MEPWRRLVASRGRSRSLEHAKKQPGEKGIAWRGSDFRAATMTESLPIDCASLGRSEALIVHFLLVALKIPIARRQVVTKARKAIFTKKCFVFRNPRPAPGAALR